MSDNKYDIDISTLPPVKVYIKRMCPYAGGTKEYYRWYWGNVTRINKLIKQRMEMEKSILEIHKEKSIVKEV